MLLSLLSCFGFFADCFMSCVSLVNFMLVSLLFIDN